MNVHAGRSDSVTAEMVEQKLQLNMDRIFTELQKSQYSRHESDNNKENIELLEVEKKKLRDYERQIERREDRLCIREDKIVASEERISQQYKEIQDRTHDLDMRAQEMRKSASISGDVSKALVAQRSIGVNTLPAEDNSKVATPNKAVAFNMLMRIVKRGTRDKCIFAFVQWKTLTSQHRQSRNDEQISALRTENENYSTELALLREQNQVLQSQLASEKEKNLIESSRLNTLNRKLKEFEIAKIMAVQSDAGVNTSVDKMSLRIHTPEEMLETEEQMMDIARQRISAHVVDPDTAAIVEILAAEIVHKSEEADLDRPNSKE